MTFRQPDYESQRRRKRGAETSKHFKSHTYVIRSLCHHWWGARVISDLSFGRSETGCCSSLTHYITMVFWFHQRPVVHFISRISGPSYFTRTFKHNLYQSPKMLNRSTTPIVWIDCEVLSPPNSPQTLTRFETYLWL